MILPILKYGSPVLRKYSVDIKEQDIVMQLSENMFDTLKRSKGIGLAAPQIGLLKKIFIIDTTPLNDDDSSIEKYEKVFINPEILWACNDYTSYTEGCLSIPEIYENVLRPEKITVRYLDFSFNVIEEELDGIKARIFQHEFDHLEGVLFVDKINSLKRKLISGKLYKLKKIYTR